MCFKIILKVTKNKSFTLSLKKIHFSKNHKWGQIDNSSRFRVKILLMVQKCIRDHAIISCYYITDMQKLITNTWDIIIKIKNHGWVGMDRLYLRYYFYVASKRLKKYLNLEDFIKSYYNDSDIEYFLKVDVQYPN